MYNRIIAVRKEDSVRLDRFMAEHAIRDDDSSEFFVRRYNRALRDKYCWWMTFSRNCSNAYDNIINSDHWVLSILESIGHTFICMCNEWKKFVAKIF